MEPKIYVPAAVALYGLLLVLAVRAGDNITTNQAVDPWKPVNKDFKYIHGQEHNRYNLDFNLDPKYYDRYAGLNKDEDRIPRIHLSGWWKLRRLPDTMTEPVWNTKTNKWEGGEELTENDIGFQEGFWKPDHDDSQWPWFFVPGDWNRQFTGNDEKKTSYSIGGVGWFRRIFALGEVPSGYRVILHFEYVEKKSTVWINGQEIGTYTTYENHVGGNILRGNSAEQHEYDITTAVKPNAENQITVRVFHNGLVSYKAGYYGRNQTGGIWQPLWIDIVPPIYAETIYVTPSLKDGSVSLKCSLRNTLPDSREARFRVCVKPWQSYRYEPPIKDVSTTIAKLGEKKIPAGRSELTFNVNLKDPVLWSHELPFLYHAQLYAKLDGKEALIGQARFGFREFKTDRTQFLLNGKRIYLSGMQPNEPYRESTLIAANDKDWALDWCKSLKKANMFYIRLHSGHYPDPFYDTADEIGVMICAERLLPQYEDTPEFEASVKRLIDDYYNHPSVVTYSLGNEHFSFGANRKQILELAPAFSRLYDLYKKYDRTRPITACSGSSGICFLTEEDYAKWPKEDYHDNHDYTGGGSKQIALIPESIRYYRERYARLDPDGIKPYVNGECIAIYQPADYKAPLKNTILPLKNTLPDLDRQLYVELINTFKSYRHDLVQWFVSQVGIRACIENMDNAVADCYRQILEHYRVHGMEQVGFNLHSIDGEFLPKTALGRNGFSHVKSGTVHAVLQEKLQPIYAMCDSLNKNCFAGKPLSFRLIAMNDTMQDMGPATVAAAIMAGNEKKAEKVIKIPSFTQARHHNFDVIMDIPADLETGHYALKLTVNDEAGQVLARNEYRLHVLGKPPELGKVQTRKAVIYTGLKNPEALLKKILDGLGVICAETRDFEGLEKFGVLIIAQSSCDENVKKQAHKIQNFLDRGGRVLMLEQANEDAYLIIPGLTCCRLANKKIYTTTDIITLSHPAFRGMDRKDFLLWNDNVCPVSTVIMPLSPVALAATAKVGTKLEDNMGMAVGEITFGKGVYLFSQINGIENYENDSVAARYINNLVQYCVSDEWANKYAVAAPVAEVHEKLQPLNPESCFFVDLRSYCNRSFTDEIADDKQGGWVDDGASSDMCVILLGKQTFAGVPFEIIDPARNNGKSCVVLGGQRKPYFPDRVENIKIGHKVARLYFLVAPTWTPNKPGLNIGRIAFHYELDGMGTTGECTEQLIVGRNVADWTRLSSRLPGAHVAFNKLSEKGDKHVGALVIPWENPIPDETIESIDIISTGQAVPVIIAITGVRQQ